MSALLLVLVALNGFRGLVRIRLQVEQDPLLRIFGRIPLLNVGLSSSPPYTSHVLFIPFPGL